MSDDESEESKDEAEKSEDEPETEESKDEKVESEEEAEGSEKEVGAPKHEKPEEKSEPVKSDAEPFPSDEEEVVPPGNKPNWVRGGLIALFGAAIPFLFMATDRHWSVSVQVGFLGCLIAFIGIADALGTFDDPIE